MYLFQIKILTGLFWNLVPKPGTKVGGSVYRFENLLRCGKFVSRRGRRSGAGFRLVVKRSFEF